MYNSAHWPHRGLYIASWGVWKERIPPSNSHMSGSGVLKSSHLPRMSSWPELYQWLFLYIAFISANNPHYTYFNITLGRCMFIKLNFKSSVTESH